MSNEIDPIKELASLVNETLQGLMDSPEFKTLQKNLEAVSLTNTPETKTDSQLTKLNSDQAKLRKMQEGLNSLNKFKRDMNSLRNS